MTTHSDHSEGRPTERFTFGPDLSMSGATWRLSPRKDGEWMRYADHEAELAREKELHHDARVRGEDRLERLGAAEERTQQLRGELEAVEKRAVENERKALIGSDKLVEASLELMDLMRQRDAAEARAEYYLSGVREAAKWAEQEALEAAGDQAGAKTIDGADWHAGARSAFNRTEAKLSALLDSEPQKQGEVECKTCDDSGEVETGECKVFMSGPTCFNAACPPCQFPGKRPCPDCTGRAVAGAAVEGGGGPETCSTGDCDRQAVAEVRVEEEGWHPYCADCARTLQDGGHEVRWSLAVIHRNLQHQPSDTTDLAPDQGGRKESAGELRSGVEGEARALAAKRLRQAAGPRTDKPINVRVAVQNLHDAADLLSTQQPSLQGLIEELELKAVAERRLATSRFMVNHLEAASDHRARESAFKEAAQLLRDSEVGK